MRILHLIDPASPAGGPGTLRLAAEALARTAGADHDVLIVGNSRHLRSARRCGLKTRGRLGAPLNRPSLARSGLRSYLAASETVGRGYDLLHVWTLSAAGLAVMEAAGRPVLATAVAGSAASVPRTLRRRLLSVPVLAATAALGGDLEAAGWASGLLSPGVDRGAIDPQQRVLLRERWGADETTFVAGLVGEPPAWADGRLALNALGRVALSGRDVKLVLHHEATAPDDLRRWLSRLGLSDIVVMDDAVVEPWRIVAGLDAALVANGIRARAAAPSVTPVLWAMAAGLPVVAEATASIRGLINDGASGLLFAPSDTHGAAAHLLWAHDHSREAARIGDAAQATVERRFGVGGFAARLDAVYEQCVKGEPICVPEVAPEPTGPRDAHLIAHR
ncbi:MAG: glycosyltransferase [Planctomycetota bacterium]